MNKLSYISVITLILLPLMFNGCGQKKSTLKLGVDGYGRTILPNGITVLVNQDASTSLSAARLLIGGGVLTETSVNNGLTNLMTKMLLKGNDVMTAAEITEKLDFLGANVSLDCFRDYSAISIVALTENFDLVMDIISRSLQSPSFPEEELARLVHEVEGEIKAINDNQGQASSLLYWRTIYGDRGYGLSTIGTSATITGITVADIKEHYQKYVGGRNIIFSIATDMPAETITTLTDKWLGGVKVEAETVPRPVLNLQSTREGFTSFDRNQSFVFMGYAMDHLQPDEVPYLILLNEVLGNGVGSRIWSLRQVEKLAYTVYSQYILNRYDANFRAAIGTDTTKIKQALGSLEREWNKLVKEGITEEELTDAKVNMKNNLIYGIDRKANRANNMAYYEYIGYDYRFILKLIETADLITLAGLDNFIKEKLTDDRLYWSIVGKK
ncbi:MAG: pitrilysin family protein [candidate division Zixibacteria bacterium]|nr:pitrilysin family protein [candidate division Zixibacteria bacterium]MDD5426997.1 pitrilysin family protein [candidate division Zixibacteria bacterium]